MVPEDEGKVSGQKISIDAFAAFANYAASSDSMDKQFVESKRFSHLPSSIQKNVIAKSEQLSSLYDHADESLEKELQFC